MKRAIRYKDYLIKSLRNSREAAAYLNAVAEDGDIHYILKALRNVVKAQGGIQKLSRKTKMSRTTLYKTLSENGNPEFKTMETILKVYGIRIGFLPAQTSKWKKAA